MIMELISFLFSNNYISDFDSLMIYLESIASKSRTSKHRINCLIKPVFIMLIFIRTEREGNWPLHLWTMVGYLRVLNCDKDSAVCIVVKYSVIFKVKENYSVPIYYLFYPSQKVFYIELVPYSDSLYKIQIESIIKY